MVDAFQVCDGVSKSVGADLTGRHYNVWMQVDRGPIPPVALVGQSATRRTSVNGPSCPSPLRRTPLFLWPRPSTTTSRLSFVRLCFSTYLITLCSCIRSEVQPHANRLLYCKSLTEFCFLTTHTKKKLTSSTPLNNTHSSKQLFIKYWFKNYNFLLSNSIWKYKNVVLTIYKVLLMKFNSINFKRHT